MKNRFPLLFLLFFSHLGIAAEKNFEMHSYLYLNISDAGYAGESYLLNQQLSSIQISLDWKVLSFSKLHSMFVYNFSPTPLYPTYYFDELYNQFQWSSNWYSKGGRQWIPFGNYRSDLIYKPLTKTLGQTNEDAFLIGYDNQSIYSNISIFRPHTEIKNSSLPFYYNINMGTKNENFDVGFSYIYSIADTQFFRYNTGFGGYMGEEIISHVPGIASYLNYNYEKINMNLSVVSAIKKFAPEDLFFADHGAKPATFSAQTGYAFQIKNTLAKIIGFYDLSYQSLALKIPKERAGVGFNLYPYSFVDVQFQCFKDYAYAKDTVAGGLNDTVVSNGKVYDTIALQLLFRI